MKPPPDMERFAAPRWRARAWRFCTARPPPNAAASSPWTRLRVTQLPADETSDETLPASLTE
eukprot:CAMPEP_0180319946 /NCGR_PEP_ID=MMETSP0988-20121125/35292_1 /TAXON_ID=697907 /ORGANISM="non described non described, Strain CCMP2293" /LENGTH=61 /DNA_ID=CAMNT_0022305603 /DNA_START=79 /DNA_END=264 /DNA_ORIENTATION=-